MRLLAQPADHGADGSMKAALFATALVIGAGAAHAESASYAIDPTHTFVHFEADHLGTSTLRGRFDRKDGRVTIDRAARTGSAEITIDLASVSTGVAALDGRLQGRDFFDAAAYPTAAFVADRFGFDGDKITEVAGTLSLLGKALPVVLQARRFNCYQNPLLSREVCGGDFEATIVRSQWGMGFGLDRGLPDRIRLLIQVEAIRQ
jgi:polyisoprenoid-binding protein YceI